MDEQCFFELHLFGMKLRIDTDAPELLVPCLQALYGTRYRRTCKSGSEADGSKSPALVLNHGLRKSDFTETKYAEQVMLDEQTESKLWWNKEERKGRAGLPPGIGRDVMKPVFTAVSAFVQFVMNGSGIFFIHASALNWKEEAILFAGPNGSGKSTLMRDMLERGAEYLADDSAPLISGSSPVEIMSAEETISAVDLSSEEIDLLLKRGFSRGPDQRFLAPAHNDSKIPVRTILFPQWVEEVPGIFPLTNKDAAMKILKLSKTSLAEEDYEKMLELSCELAGSALSAVLAIQRGTRFPVDEIIEFHENSQQ